MHRVLVVEDDEANAKVFDKLLSRFGGFDVCVTEDVSEVLTRVRENTVDLLVLDVSLSSSTHQGRPVSGLDISRLIKDRPKTENLPVVLVTAHALPGDREKFLAQSKADDYLTKPIVDPKAMVELFRRLIARRSVIVDR